MLAAIDRAPITSESMALRSLSSALKAADYDFVTVTPASHAIVNSRKGDLQAQTLRDIFGWSRAFEPDLLPADLFDFLSTNRLVHQVDERLWKSHVRLSALRGDLYVHSAFPTLAQDAIFFGPDTYKFTDAIASLLTLRSEPVARAIDICSGAGAGAITIAKAHPLCRTLMVDINPAALRYGAVNALCAGCDSVETECSGELADVGDNFDLIVAHPPYLVDRDQRAYRHGGKALGAELALAIVQSALRRLAPNGTLLLFTGVAIVDGEDAFLASVKPWISAAACSLRYREVDPDVFGEELATPAYSDVDRIALVVLEVTRPGSTT